MHFPLPRWWWCVEKVRVPPCWAAYLSLNESLKNGLSNLQGDKVVGKELESTKLIERIHQDLHKIQVYSLGACDSSGLFIARRHENQTQTDRCHGRAFDATCLGRNFLAIRIVFLKLIEVHGHWCWHKASGSIWTILSVYSSFCYNLCPQLAKNPNLEFSNKNPSVHKRNVPGFFWARKFFGRSCSRLPTVSTIIGVRFSSKSWKQFCVSSKTKQGQWRTHSSTEEKSCTTPAAAPPQHACRGQI